MRMTRVVTFGLIAVLLTGLPILAASKNVAESKMVLDGKYPTSEHHLLVVPSDIDHDVYACVGTSHDNKKTSNEGYNVAKITIRRPDSETGEESVENHGKRGSLVGGKWLRCIHTGPLKAGDIVEFWYEFSNYPRPRGSTIHIRSTLGEARMLISELRGPEARGNTGVPTQYHQRVSNGVSENGKHPKFIRQASVVHADSLDKVDFCVAYGNTIVKKPSKGSVRITAEIGRTDPETGEITIEKQVLKASLKDNKIKKCVVIDPVSKGDTLIVDVELTGFPRLQGNAEVDGVAMGGDRFELLTGIGPNPMLLGEVLGPPTPSAGGGGGGGGGGEGGAPPTDTDRVSAAEQRVFSALSKMTAIGIGTRSRGGKITWLIAHRYSCSNYMETKTIVGVYDLFVKACGARATGGALTKSQINAIAKFKRAIGITGLRWESGNRVIGEYNTKATGTVHKTFSTIEAAVKWLDGQHRFE